MTRPVFLSPAQVRAIRAEFGTPLFVYDEATLAERARLVTSFPSAFGLTPRYAMKALPNAAIVRLLVEHGLHLDVSSGFEAQRAIDWVGVAPEKLQLTAQELPENLKELVERGVLFNACSLHQLRTYGQLFPNTEVSVRINPGLGSGHSNRTNVGGPSSSFGIWHEHLDEVLATAAEFGVSITGMHTHIGSGSDPEVWDRCARMSLDIAARMPHVNRLSLGGGFKVARMAGEVEADLHVIGQRVAEDLRAFAEEHGRELHLEVEPGTFLVAHAGTLLCDVMDVVDTGAEGRRFIKIDGGMTEILRPSMYGAQHPIALVSSEDGERAEHDYMIVGHCCESGDILTPESGNPEGLAPRTLPEARIGDTLVIDAAGAYCAAMPAKHYNSFPECAEVLLNSNGTTRLIRKRQPREQVYQNEVLD